MFQLTNGELWWAGMKMAYKPEKMKIEVAQPKLFAAGSKCFAVVDQENNVRLFFNLLDFHKLRLREGEVRGELIYGCEKG